MKKIITFAILALAAFVTIPAEAQLKFGIKGGVNISSVHFDSKVLDADNVTGFQIGPMIETGIPVLGIGLDAAILYSQKGVGFGSEEIKNDYIDVPVNLKWKFGLPIVKAYLAAGPYVGFRVGGDKIWNVIGEQIEAKSFSAGLNFGAGVELLRHLQVGFNYGLGLADNYSSEPLNVNTSGNKISGKNRGWSITAAILF